MSFGKDHTYQSVTLPPRCFFYHKAGNTADPDQILGHPVRANS